MTPHLYTDCVQRGDFRKHLFESGTLSILLCPMPGVVFSKCGCRQSWGLSLFPMRKSSCRTCLLSHLQLVPASPQPHQPHWSPIVCVTCSVMSDSLCLMDCSPSTPWSVEFSRQEYWSGQPFPSPGDLPDPGTESRFPECR